MNKAEKAIEDIDKMIAFIEQTKGEKPSVLHINPADYDLLHTRALKLGVTSGLAMSAGHVFRSRVLLKPAGL